MKEIFLNVFTSVMMVLVVSALYTGITYLKKYVDETVSRLKNNAFAQSSFYFIENFIAGLTKTAVAAMEQTKASELRERVAQGLASKEDLKALAVEVRDGVKAQITPLMKDELDKYILNLDSYIDERIEASVLELKRNDVK